MFVTQKMALFQGSSLYACCRLSKIKFLGSLFVMQGPTRVMLYRDIYDECQWLHASLHLLPSICMLHTSVELPHASMFIPNQHGGLAKLCLAFSVVFVF